MYLAECVASFSAVSLLKSLAATTWEIDRDKGTEYHQRFNTFMRYAQKNDLVVSGSVTDPKGDRSKRPLEQDPDFYVHVVEKKADGIVVNGAKQHATGAYAADGRHRRPQQPDSRSHSQNATTRRMQRLKSSS